MDSKSRTRKQGTAAKCVMKFSQVVSLFAKRDKTVTKSKIFFEVRCFALFYAPGNVKSFQNRCRPMNNENNGALIEREVNL